MSRVFPNMSDGVICPLCGTSEDKPCVLVPILGTEKRGNMEAKPTHLNCIIDKIVCYQDGHFRIER